MKSHYHKNDRERYSREENLLAYHLAICHRYFFQVDLNGFENRRVSIGYTNIYIYICLYTYALNKHIFICICIDVNMHNIYLYTYIHDLVAKTSASKSFK